MGLFGGGGLLGMGGTAGKILDPGDALGYQAQGDAAAKNEALGYETLDMQQDWMKQLQGLYDPYINAGTDALGMQTGMLGDIQGLMSGPDYAAAADSPMYQNMMQQGAQGITSQAAATGGLRGGNVQNALAENSQNALIQTANQDYANKMGSTMNYYNTLAGLSGQGLGASSMLGNQGGNVIGGMADTYGGIASGSLNEAAGQSQKGTGVMSLIGGLFSDVRLKSNVKKTGKKTAKGYDIYSWDWNLNAEELGLSGSDTGVIAQEVEKIDPDAVVVDESGYKKVNYARV